MSDVAQTTVPKKKQLLDNTFIKSLLSVIAWLGPVPVSVVALQIWLTKLAPEDQRGSDPFVSIRHSMMNFSGTIADWILLLSLLPSALLLLILYRSAKSRICAIAALVIFAAAAMLLTVQILSGVSQ